MTKSENDNTGKQNDDTVAPSNQARPPEGDATIAPGSNKNSSPYSVRVPELDNFEIIEELGRGGMGVVYKARDKKLDRVVALKMIIGGVHASEEDLARFRQEAHAAAKLDHEAIVPIYDVCEKDSVNQFFSMKMIDGGSLDKKQSEYADPKHAVELVLEIAKGVHHAHQRGILHRDLKPANILVDAAGQPMITDLGLAKNLSADSGLTQTGMVMGTPGFMAPEQAAGKGDITTSADIYSLGSILYWLVAGRPPFQGETQMDVILKTIQQEADSIRLHRANIDRGLDLICQKALKNSPDERYPNAAELISDLAAWLNGDPLSVKPPTTLELAKIWFRKNFRMLAIGSLGGVFCGGMIGLIIFAVITNEMLDWSNSFNQLGEKESNWVQMYFSWLSAVPKSLLNMLPFCIILLTVFSGIAIIGFLKPNKRDTAFAAALTAGLFAGILAFTISLGWAPLIKRSVEKGTPGYTIVIRRDLGPVAT